MKTKLCYFSIALTVLAALTGPVRAAVGFTVTPSAVSNTYAGTITLQVTGLTNTEAVIIQKFLDLNANAAIDGGDLLVQQFDLTDGQAGMVIGGVTNFNVPGDLNAANGIITAALSFQNGDFVQNIAGRYLYKLSSPVGHLTPLTSQLAVTNFPFAQKIIGNVISNNSSATVPNAVVLLFEPKPGGKSGPGKPIGGVVADNFGSFTFSLPPGTYLPLAFSSNYVCNFAAPPRLTLGANQTLATNLTLTLAEAGITGNVRDANSTSIRLPGVWLFGLGTNGLVAVTSADAAGNFNMRVTAGEWAFGAQYSAVGIHGYLGWYDDPYYHANAGATGVNLDFLKANALFYGSVKDNLGNPMPGIVLESNDNNETYYTESYTDADGNYAIGALGGLANDQWRVNVESDPNPTNYIFSYRPSGPTAVGEAVRADFTAIPATHRVTGSLKDNNGNPIVGVGIWADATIEGLDYHVDSVDTDSNGNYSLNVGNGTWYVGGFPNLPDDCLSPGDQVVIISNNDAVLNFTVECPSRLTLDISWSNGMPLLSVSGAINDRFALEYVPALSDDNQWLNLKTNTLTSNPFFLLDTNAVGNASRFYRARLVP